MVFGKKKKGFRDEEYVMVLENILDRLEKIEKRSEVAVAPVLIAPEPLKPPAKAEPELVTNHIADVPQKIIEEATEEREAIDVDNLDVDAITAHIRAAVQGELTKIQEHQKKEDPIPKLTKLEDMVYALRKMAGIGEDTTAVPENRDAYMNLYAQITISDLVHWTEDMVHKGQHALANMASKDLRDMYDRFRVDLDLVLNTADIEITKLKQEIEELEKRNKQLHTILEKEKQLSSKSRNILEITNNKELSKMPETIVGTSKRLQSRYAESQLKEFCDYIEVFMRDYIEKNPEKREKWFNPLGKRRRASLQQTIRKSYLEKINKSNELDLRDYLTDFVEKKFNIPEFKHK